MGSPLIVLTEDVEQKKVHVVVERLVVQEQLCQVAQVLAVLLLLLAIHLLRSQLSQLNDLQDRATECTAPNSLRSGQSNECDGQKGTCLKHGHITAGVIAVDLIAGRVLQLALAQVANHLIPGLEERQIILRKV